MALVIFALPAQEAFSFIESDNFFLTTNSQIQFALRPLGDGWLRFPALGTVSINSGLEISESLYFGLSAFGKLPVKSFAPHVDAFVDLGETYLKYTHRDFVLSFGHLSIPWRTLRGAALNDRVNPVDYRRGLNFANDSNARIPQWGMSFSTVLLGWTTQSTYFLWHRSDPSSRIAEEQNGIQIGRYQGIFAGFGDELALIMPMPFEPAPSPWLSEPTVAFRMSKLLGDLNLGLNVVWGVDEVPAIMQRGKLSHGRNFSFGADSSISLGVVILKAEAVVTPKFGDNIGKFTLLKSSNLLRSQPLTNVQLGIGVDGQYGDVISGSLELIDTLWFSVPSGVFVYSVESPETDLEHSRFVQRIALATVFSGKFLDEAATWNFRGEIGLNRLDLLSILEAQYQFAESGFSLGAFANLFFGVAQTPGWFRTRATEFGIRAVYNM